MRKYEIMYIVRPTLSAEEIKNVIDSFNKILTSNKATI
jgi:ribosomal protein S6